MTPNQKASKFEAALTEVADIAKRIGQRLELKADAQQACFATILISADRNGLFFDLANPELPPNGTTEVSRDEQAARKADAQIQDAPRQPTPEQAEAGALKALRDGVKRACRLLNEEGYKPVLSPTTIDAYIKKKTELGKPFGDLDSEDLEALIRNLTFKLDELRAAKKSQEDKAGF